MTNIRIAIDNVVQFDGDPGDWINTPPDFFKDRIRPGFQPEPYVKAIMLAMTDAVMLGQSLNMDVHTTPKSWTLIVETV